MISSHLVWYIAKNPASKRRHAGERNREQNTSNIKYNLKKEVKISSVLIILKWN